MKVSWMGHSSFLVETKEGTKIITDPYEPGGFSGAVGYAPINIQADIVTISHQHEDHNYIRDFSSAEIVDKSGKITIKDVEIEGILSYHDDKKGETRGRNMIFVIKTEGIKIVHFGDLGTGDIDIEKFENSDIVLIPVGGTFTIDAEQAAGLVNRINPKIVVPMHFKTSKLRFDIDGVENFLKNNQDYEKREELEVDSQNIDSFKKVVVLNYKR